MPRTDVILYQEVDGTVPLLEWFDELPPKALSKCRVSIERLGQLGHELRRPEADYLRDDIYELRIRFQSVNYPHALFLSRPKGRGAFTWFGEKESRPAAGGRSRKRD